MLLRTAKCLSASGPEDRYVCCAACGWEHVALTSEEAEYKLLVHLGTHAGPRLRTRLGDKVPYAALGG